MLEVQTQVELKKLNGIFPSAMGPRLKMVTPVATWIPVYVVSTSGYFRAGKKIIADAIRPINKAINGTFFEYFFHNTLFSYI